MADSSTTSTTQLFELWRKQFEDTTAAWTRLVGQVPAAPTVAGDPFAFWRPVLNQGLETWAKLFSTTPVTPDLLSQWKQFLDQWIEAWSRILAQAMNTEAYAQTMGKILDQALVTQGPIKKATDQAIEGALQTLNLASRSQLTSIAKQIVELEERLERMEDGIEAIRKSLVRKEPT